MALTGAERQRRSRRHRAGDHSLCEPDNPGCHAVTVTVTPTVTPTVTSVVTVEPADGGVAPLGPGGARLWRDLGGEEATGGRRVLIQEACRITDRLDKLDRLLAGDATDWLGLVEAKGHPDRQEVVIDKPLAEARQQATALKQIVAELRQAGGAEQPEQGVDVLDQLAARRAARLADAAGR